MLLNQFLTSHSRENLPARYPLLTSPFIELALIACSSIHLLNREGRGHKRLIEIVPSVAQPKTDHVTVRPTLVWQQGSTNFNRFAGLNFYLPKVGIMKLVQVVFVNHSPFPLPLVPSLHRTVEEGTRSDVPPRHLYCL